MGTKSRKEKGGGAQTRIRPGELGPQAGHRTVFVLSKNRQVTFDQELLTLGRKGQIGGRQAMKITSITAFIGIVGFTLVPPVSAAQPAKFKETVVYSFCGGGCPCADGEWPSASLIDVKGTLYGTTVFGGADADGAVFAVNQDTGAETVLYSFCSQGSGGNCLDGELPEASLIEVNGTLYGTTAWGGSGGDGTVFSIDMSTGVETVLHNFAGGADGAYIQTGLIEVKDALYGTAYDGGTGCGGHGGCGIVFSVDLNTGAETILHTFGIGADGASP